MENKKKKHYHVGFATYNVRVRYRDTIYCGTLDGFSIIKPIKRRLNVYEV